MTFSQAFSPFARFLRRLFSLPEFHLEQPRLVPVRIYSYSSPQGRPLPASLRRGV